MYCEEEIPASGNELRRHASNNAPAQRAPPKACQDTATEEFWQQYLSRSEETVFPQIPASVKRVHRSEVVTHRTSLSSSAAGSRRSSVVSLIQTAWALLLGRYTESQDVVITTRATIPRRATEDSLIIPLRFKIRKETYARELSQQAEKFTRNLVESQELVDSCTGRLTDPFSNSLLLIQSLGKAHGLLAEVPCNGPVPSNCALLLHCIVDGDEVHVLALYDPHVMYQEQTQRILNQLDHILHQLADPATRVGDIDFLSPQDREDIARWNSGCGPPDACIHTLISHHVQTRPDAPAVSAHDGDLTYAELDAHAAKLAHHLVTLGVHPGSFVPTLFEKSKWTQIAVLAVLKAGAAFAMLDPAHPAARNQQIARTASAAVALASPRHASVLSRTVASIVVLDAPLIARLPHPTPASPPLPRPSPTAAAYVLFTSGSSGTPKGAVLEHRSFAAAARALAAATRMTPATRALQLGSYSFGAAVVEMLATLAAGGAVCVPSDAERASDVEGFAARARVDWAFMTPSFARTVDPARLESLRVLATGGEPVAPDLLHAWAGRVALYAVYGSAEQSSIAAVAGPLAVGQRDGGAGVGRPFAGSYAWVVEAGAAERLVPVGCVGELVLEGPLVARGYLGDVERTRAAFPEGFAWRREFAEHPGGKMRFYRTGDLVRYGPGGTLEFVGRREGYVKLRGQRVELGEIEFQLKRVIATPLDLCVEVIVPKDANLDKAALVVFAGLGDEYEGKDDVEVPSLWNRKRVAELLGDVEQRLADALPSHMVPHFFYPLHHLPLSVSGKVLRKSLWEMGARLSAEQLAGLSLHQSTRTEPRSDMEKYLQAVWAKLLGISASAISAEDSFFSVGGDSLKAIKLFQQLRRDGFDLDVPGIMAAPVLSQMALKARLTEG